MKTHRQYPLKTCLAATLLLVSTAAMPQAAPDKRQAPAAAKKSAPARATHLLHLTALRLVDSGWTDQRVLNAVRTARRILAQCSVKLERMELVSLAVPQNLLDFSRPMALELVRDYRVTRPAVYFVRDTLSSPALGAEAIGHSSSGTTPVLASTVWITAAIRDPGVALARELAHVLMDSGDRSEEPGNLMREQTSARSTALTPAQCSRMRETAGRNGLLKKAK
ncbi:MAG: hypothetical protein A2W04_10770 [Betaproteobacteria bacterium RBG_16_64_9]|nr:MAG: hypothetical protein A2W04_10770 [Betaproteobacteria bacterium RBG_16_64_9]